MQSPREPEGIISHRSALSDSSLTMAVEKRRIIVCVRICDHISVGCRRGCFSIRWTATETPAIGRLCAGFLSTDQSSLHATHYTNHTIGPVRRRVVQPNALYRSMSSTRQPFQTLNLKRHNSCLLWIGHGLKNFSHRLCNRINKDSTSQVPTNQSIGCFAVPDVVAPSDLRW
jgi:hypothetical protein